MYRSLFTLVCLSLLFAGSLHMRRAHSIERDLLRAARGEGLDPRLLSAVAWQESRYRAEAIGAAGEVGMFQVIPAAAGADWAKARGHAPLSPEHLARTRWNAQVAAYYLRQGLQQYRDRRDPRAYSLARYNAGPTRLQAWAERCPPDGNLLDHIEFDGTRRYVERILERLEASTAQVLN